MNDNNKSKKQLIEELNGLRAQVATLEDRLQRQMPAATGEDGFPLVPAGLPGVYAVRIVHADGSKRRVEVSEIPVRNSGGKAVSIAGTAHDGTERKQDHTNSVHAVQDHVSAAIEQEQKVKKSVEHFRHMAENIEQGLTILENRKVVYINKRITEITGYTLGELNTMHLDDIVAPADKNLIGELLEKYNRDGTLPEETVFGITRKDGAVRFVHSLYSAQKTGPIMNSYIVTTDITERKKAEEERIRLTKAIEGAAEIVLIMDAGGTVLYANPAATKLTGYSAAEIIGTNIFEMSSSTCKGLYDKLHTAFNKGGVWTETLTHRHKDGTPCIFDTTISPIFDESGKLVNLLSVGRDATRETMLEKQILQSQKMKALGTLAGGIAHDFNNILAGIIGYTELALEDVEDRPKTQELLQQARESAERARELVGQILTFSRTAEIEKKPIKTVPIVKEVCKFLRSSMPSTIEIRQNIKTENGWVMADPTQVHQILMNLGTNAGHAMRQKGGVLQILVEEIFIGKDDVVAYKDLKTGHYLHLTTKDTGHGIKKADLSRIFDPYFSTKKKGEGTGLGLAVVHGIVKDHGGDIRVHSTLNKGTTFHVVLPLMKKTPVHRETGNSENLPTGTEHILLVDDEPDLVKIIKLVLERLGYRVIGVTGAEEALETFKLARNSYGLVITDKTMPEMTGFDLAKKIKQIRPDIPILLCTGYNETDDEAKAEAAGIDAVVTKPIQQRELAEKIRAALDTDAHRHKHC